MNIIYEKNGFIYIHSEDPNYEIPNWATTDYQSGDPYFLLNCYTKVLFMRDFKDLINDRVFTINKYLYEDIAKFEQNPKHPIVNELITTHKEITLKDHQITALKLMLQYDRYALFYGTGTGKTLIAVFYLMTARPKKVLIVTPKKVVQQFRREVMNRLIGLYRVEQTKVLDDAVVIVNPEALHKIKYTKIDCLIIDESHKAKNYMSKANKILRDIAKVSRNIYLFTGTPQDKLNAEIFPQLAILDERVYPSKTRFNFRYFTIDDYHNPKSAKAHLKDEIKAMINSYSFGVKTIDVVDLPKLHSIRTFVENPGKIYNDLLTKRVVKILKDSHMYICEADSPTTLRTKLQEICSGFILHLEEVEKNPLAIVSQGNIINKIKKVNSIVLKSKINKQAALRNLLVDTKERFIIFTCFDIEVDLVKEVILGLGMKYAVINGRTSIEDTEKIKMWLKNNNIDVIIANVKCTSEGLDLYFINNIVFYSLPDSYITYHQCCSRINRIGQEKEMYIYHLLCKNSVEEHKYLTLSRKSNYTNKLFQNYILRKED